MYIDKLAELKKVGDRIMNRYNENEGRQGALNTLGSSLVHIRKILEQISNKVRYLYNSRYIHCLSFLYFSLEKLFCRNLGECKYYKCIEMLQFGMLLNVSIYCETFTVPL